MTSRRHVASTGLLATLVVFCIDLRASAETWQLTYDTVSVTDTSETQGAPAHQETADSRLTLWLGEHQFAMRNDDAVAIFDFEKASMIVVGRDGKTYERIPLIAHVSFRMMELPNRIWIHSGLGEEEGENTITLADLETLFGLPWDGPLEDLPRGKVELEEEGNTFNLRQNGELTSTAELSVEPKLDKAHAAMYAKWLLYGCRLHPRLWDALAERGEVARRLKYSFRDTFEDTQVTLKLSSAERLNHWPDLLPKHAIEAVDDASPVAVWASRLRNGDDLPHRQTREDVERMMDDAVRRGRPVDALLASVEWSLQSGERLTEKSNPIRDAAADDPQVIAYRQALDIGPQQPTEANELYESIPREGLDKGYVLDIFIANNLTALGDVPQAYERFANALDHNPYITGVWYDLGNLSMRNFDTFTGWRMFETARLIQPDHPMLSPLDDYEVGIRTRFPRFFVHSHAAAQDDNGQ